MALRWAGGTLLAAVLGLLAAPAPGAGPPDPDRADLNPDLSGRWSRMENISRKDLIAGFIVSGMYPIEDYRENQGKYRYLFDRMDGIQVLRRLGSKETRKAPWICWKRQLDQFKTLGYFEAKLFFTLRDSKGRVRVYSMKRGILIPSEVQVMEGQLLRKYWFGTSGEPCMVTDGWWHVYGGILGARFDSSMVHKPKCKSWETLFETGQPFVPEVCAKSIQGGPR